MGKIGLKKGAKKKGESGGDENKVQKEESSKENIVVDKTRSDVSSDNLKSKSNVDEESKTDNEEKVAIVASQGDDNDDDNVSDASSVKSGRSALKKFLFAEKKKKLSIPKSKSGTEDSHTPLDNDDKGGGDDDNKDGNEEQQLTVSKSKSSDSDSSTTITNGSSKSKKGRRKSSINTSDDNNSNTSSSIITATNNSYAELNANGKVMISTVLSEDSNNGVDDLKQVAVVVTKSKSGDSSDSSTVQGSGNSSKSKFSKLFNKSKNNGQNGNQDDPVSVVRDSSFGDANSKSSTLDNNNEDGSKASKASSGGNSSSDKSANVSEDEHTNGQKLKLLGNEDDNVSKASSKVSISSNASTEASRKSSGSAASKSSRTGTTNNEDDNVSKASSKVSISSNASTKASRKSSGSAASKSSRTGTTNKGGDDNGNGSSDKQLIPIVRDNDDAVSKASSRASSRVSGGNISKTSTVNKCEDDNYNNVNDEDTPPPKTGFKAMLARLPKYKKKDVITSDASNGSTEIELSVATENINNCVDNDCDNGETKVEASSSLTSKAHSDVEVGEISKDNNIMATTAASTNSKSSRISNSNSKENGSTTSARSAKNSTKSGKNNTNSSRVSVTPSKQRLEHLLSQALAVSNTPEDVARYLMEHDATSQFWGKTTLVADGGSSGSKNDQMEKEEEAPVADATTATAAHSTQLLPPLTSFERPALLPAASSMTHNSYARDNKNSMGSPTLTKCISSDACSINTELILSNGDDENNDHDRISNNGDGKEKQTDPSSTIKKKNFSLFGRSSSSIATSIVKKDKNKNENNSGSSNINPAKQQEEEDQASARKDNDADTISDCDAKTKSSDASSTVASSNPSETKSEYTSEDHMPVTTGAACTDECGAFMDTVAMTTCDPRVNQEDEIIDRVDNAAAITNAGNTNTASKSSVASCGFDPKGLTQDVMTDLKDAASSIKRMFGVSYNFPALSYSSLKDHGGGVEMVLDGGNNNNLVPRVSSFEQPLKQVLSDLSNDSPFYATNDRKEKTNCGYGDATVISWTDLQK